MELDYSQYNTVIGLRHKGGTEFVKIIMPGEPYDWPEELDFDTAEFVSIGIPPQHEDEAELELEVLVEDPLRDCSKCESGRMRREEVCCSERAAGFKWKWICDSCPRIVYSKGD